MQFYKATYTEVNDIKSLAKAVKLSLKYWLDAHYTLSGWIHRNWGIERWKDLETFVENEDWDSTLEYKCLGGKVHFHIKTEYLVTLAKSGLFKVCCKCGFADFGWLNCCPECGGRLSKPSREYCEEVSSYFIPPVYAEEMLKTLRRCFHRYYKEVVLDYIEPHIWEIKLALRELNLRKIDLHALMWCLHIRHVGGVVSEDYGAQFGLDYELVGQISSDGLESVFGKEEVSKYL